MTNQSISFSKYLSLLRKPTLTDLLNLQNIPLQYQDLLYFLLDSFFHQSVLIVDNLSHPSVFFTDLPLLGAHKILLQTLLNKLKNHTKPYNYNEPIQTKYNSQVMGFISVANDSRKQILFLLLEPRWNGNIVAYFGSIAPCRSGAFFFIRLQYLFNFLVTPSPSGHLDKSTGLKLVFRS
jgi:hypothetical protein